MKNYFTYLYIVLFSAIALSSCIEDNTDVYNEYLEELEAYQEKVYAQYQADSTLIVDYIAVNDTAAVYNEQYGIFYTIVEEGSASHPDLNSIVEVKYKGTLLDGTVFEETAEDASVQFVLDRLIPGWKIGIPLIGAKGKIILYLPSVYGYAEVETNDIPANSVLIFEIELVEFY